MKVKEEIIGKEVVDISGNVIGRVKDLDVNFENQTLESFVVGDAGIFDNLGSSKGEIIIPYHEIKIIRDKVLLNNEIHKQ
ncbi:PRC-barrel domain-containing protein [Methanobacterium sp. SMA-27]|uniref:PRC-barrel domain-containing protein n=1 Tax=Methanobacterium sp. SMA-27 TaxID=1495336 RepID=UPI00064FC1F6|nr:PRC-barrel domain-containing protein [Methanobacterium sp. SMA-27]